MRFWRTPLDTERFVRPHGRIFIIVERCKGCGFCVEYCPRQVLQISKRFNKKGYHYPEAVREDACVDCDLCESLCPEFAIYSECVEERMSAPAAESAAGEVEHE
jgi:2-oxoglutarate ferredoxin oxidoreductase subunit delta